MCNFLIKLTEILVAYPEIRNFTPSVVTFLQAIFTGKTIFTRASYAKYTIDAKTLYQPETHASYVNSATAMVEHRFLNASTQDAKNYAEGGVFGKLLNKICLNNFQYFIGCNVPLNLYTRNSCSSLKGRFGGKK